MKISYTGKKINPDYPVDLSGFGYFLNRVTDFVQEDLFAHALNISHEGTQLLIITCDLLGLSSYIVDRVKTAISGKHNICKNQIIMLPTHTHTAPVVIPLIGCGQLDYAYQSFLISALVDVAEESFENTSEVVAIRRLVCPVSGVGYNRTISDGPIDNNVYGLVFETKNSGTYAIVNYACHPVTFGSRSVISADFPHYVLKNLEEKGIKGIYINGCHGDIDPIERDADSNKNAAEYGARIAQSFFNGLKSAVQVDISLEVFDFDFNISLQKIDLNELPDIVLQMNEAAEGNDSMKVAVFQWEQVLTNQILKGTITCEENVYNQAVRIGDCVLLASQGELYTEIGQRVRKNIDPEFLIFGSNANVATRYIAPDSELKDKTYGGFTSNIVDGTVPVCAGTMEEFIDNITTHLLSRRSS